MIRPVFERTGPASGLIVFGDEHVATIRDMCLCDLRLGPGGAIIIGREVPLPLYWRQYAHHEDPERHGGSEAFVEVFAEEEGRVLLRCEGTNGGREIRSVCMLEIRLDNPSGSYVVDLNTRLDVLPRKSWRVTHNPHHGELEFCNLWPEGAFSSDPGKPKAFSVCFVDRGSDVVLVPHHHLESADKHNIRLVKGDRFGWLLEEENLVVQLLSNEEASVGLCAYMWDAHIAYRYCVGPGELLLPPGTRRTASLRITRLNRRDGAAIITRGVAPSPQDLDGTPVYINGLNTFRETIRSFPDRQYEIWPWAFETPSGEAEGASGILDRTTGYDDRASLRITSANPGTGLWIASTLGPAFGNPLFRDGARYRLDVMVRTELLAGMARIGVRLHRRGSPDIGDTRSYEHFWSDASCSGSSRWTSLHVVTPPISPAPDRIHLLLSHDGRGTSWFDNVFLRSND